MDSMIVDTAERIFRDHCNKALLDAAETGEFPQSLLGVITDAGLHLVGSADSGTVPADIFEVLKVAGGHAVPLPLAEMLLANSLIGDPGAGGPGFTTIALDGEAPWARRATRVVCMQRGSIDAILATEFTVIEGANLAGEPRDRIDVQAQEPMDGCENLYEMLALARAALISGALGQILELTLVYATEREQFGRPISKFQAIQHNLAVLASEVAAAQCATDAAIGALGSTHQRLQIAAAKSRVGEAAGIVAESAHQIHGAMGFTHEHTLHHFTRRVWAWRDEYGRESEWQALLGARIAQLGADASWAFMTELG